jgi:hypothetical protein
VQKKAFEKYGAKKMADCLIKGVFQSYNIDVSSICSFAANFFVQNLQPDKLRELKEFLI